MSPGVPSPTSDGPVIIQRFTCWVLPLGLAVLAAMGTEMNKTSPRPLRVCNLAVTVDAVAFNGPSKHMLVVMLLLSTLQGLLIPSDWRLDPSVFCTV